jgi:hypothetical protein
MDERWLFYYRKNVQDLYYKNYYVNPVYYLKQIALFLCEKAETEHREH